MQRCERIGLRNAGFVMIPFAPSNSGASSLLKSTSECALKRAILFFVQNGIIPKRNSCILSGFSLAITGASCPMEILSHYILLFLTSKKSYF